jgi:WG containing repeat
MYRVLPIFIASVFKNKYVYFFLFWFNTNLLVAQYQVITAYENKTGALKYGLRDSTGKLVIKPKYVYIDTSKKGGILFYNGKKWLIFNLQTHKKHKLSARGWVLDLSDSDYWIVFSDFSEGKKFMVVDNSAKICLPYGYEHIQMINLSHFLVRKNNKFGILNQSLQIICPPKYQHIQNCTNSQLPYFQIYENGLWGLMDTLGKEILAPTHSSAISWFSEKLGVYFINRSCGLINHKLEPLGLPKYASINTNFAKTGYFGVQENNQWGLIDTNGVEILPPIFESVYAYEHDNYISIRNKDKFGFFYPNTQIFVPPIYTQIVKINPNYLQAVDVSAKLFLYDNLSGKPLIMGGFEKFEIYPDYIVAHKEEQMGVFSRSGELVADCAYDFLDYKLLEKGKLILGQHTGDWWEYDTETKKLKTYIYTSK